MKKILRHLPGVILGIVLTAMTIAFLILLNILGVVSEKYFIFIVAALALLTFFISIFLFINPKKPKKIKGKKASKEKIGIRIYRVIRYFCFFLAILLIIGYSFMVYYLNKTMNFIDNIGIITEEVTNYYIVVLTDSRYQEASDLDGTSIAYFDRTEQEVIDSIKLTLNHTAINDINKLKEMLYKEEVTSILISDIIKNRYEEENPNFNKEVRILDTISIKSEIQDITKKVSIKNAPFNVLISGIDTYGAINTKSRNDVNMVATINPNTNKILLTSIPRDYYVKLHGKKGLKDKLTHASYYGQETVVKTIEDILDIDINYYVKVNFSTVIELVDTLGGIEVYADQPVRLDGCKQIKKGTNKLNGTCALAFSRERYSYSDGDLHRGRNQQEVIKAIFKKATSSTAILTEYNNVLKVMDGKFVTNLDMDEVLNFVKYELSDLGTYTFTNTQLNGSGAMGETYSYPGQSLWIMIPNEKTIKKVKNLISETISEN